MSAANTSIRAVPGQPGTYVNEATGEAFKLVEFRDDDKYDTEAAASSISTGTKLTFFQNLTNKNTIDTNFSDSHKLSANETMVISRGGGDIPLARGNNLVRPEDIKKISYNGVLEIKLNSVVIAEGPLYKWPSGYGLSGMTNENNQGVVSIGVPSTAARRPLAKEHYITDKHQINATVTFEDRAWDTNATSLSGAAIVLNAPVHIKVYLGGLIGTAATK